MIESLYTIGNVVLGDNILYEYSIFKKAKVLNVRQIFVNNTAPLVQLIDKAKAKNALSIRVNATSQSVEWLKKNNFTFLSKKIDLKTGIMHYIYEYKIPETVPEPSEPPTPEPIATPVAAFGTDVVKELF